MKKQPPVIIDCGSGYTKMGLAGSGGPSHVIPTVLFREDQYTNTFRLSSSLGGRPASCIGNSAIRQSMADVSGSAKPIIDGRVNDWSDMELFLAHCYSEYLRIDPRERACILTEPPLNPASNRERLAEVMFETFGVPAVHIGVQAVLALHAYWDGKSAVTGTVVDSGDGVTHVIPVTDGYVLGSAVREIPVAGKDVTRVISDALQMRKEVVVDSPEMGVALNRLAKQVKEKLAYVCADPVRELKLFDASNHTLFKKISWTDPRTNLQRECEIGYEQFLGPEMFFQPSLVSNTVNVSLPMIVAESVQAAPIDYRRSLLGNIVLSGGSTLFTNFDKRLEHDVALATNQGCGVKVRSKPDIQRFAVWHGASALSQTPQFERMLISRAEYEERGPGVARETAITRCIGL